MLLQSLKLINFRNYGEQHFTFNRSFNYIFGNNGEGKTNILEAVSYISYGKSFLNSSESDCVKFDAAGFDVEGVYENDVQTEYNVYLNYDLIQKKKTFHLNKEKVKRWSTEIFGRFPVVFLSPHSLEITYGNPAERRKFFDILLAQTSRVYFDFLSGYVKILKHKNALLKNQLNGNAMPQAEFRNLLGSINEKSAELAAEILRRRIDFLKTFRDYFVKSFSYLLEKDDVPEIKYSSCGIDGFDEHAKHDADNLKAMILKSIELKTGEEIARGMALIGPHKDDYIFMLNKSADGEKKSFELKNFASQGEHKTFVIALKLVEFHYLKDNLAGAPVLLLDDLLSELDSTRVSRIVSHLKEYGQIFLTTTGRDYAEELKNFYSEDEISFFEIENGKVICDTQNK